MPASEADARDGFTLRVRSASITGSRSPSSLRAGELAAQRLDLDAIRDGLKVGRPGEAAGRPGELSRFDVDKGLSP